MSSPLKIGLDRREIPPITVLAHPSMFGLARRIDECCKMARSLQSGALREARFMEEHITWESFPDGFPNLFIDGLKDVAGKDVIFVASFHSPQVIFEQLSVVYAIPRYLARSFTIILPYFPTGTMERVDKEGQIATAKTLATLLSATPLTARGPTQIMIFDIHALQERFYFTDAVIPRLESAVPLLKLQMEGLIGEKLAIAYPDDGAHKRFHTMFEDLNLPTIICHKIRDGKKRIVKVKDGEPGGCHVIIVDDLVQTGGTLIECAKALRDKQANAVSAFVTHAVFPNRSWEKFTWAVTKSDPNGVVFENFWVTDSIPSADEVARHDPFKLLSLSTCIADALGAYDLKQN